MTMDNKSSAARWRRHLPYLLLLIAGTIILMVLALLQHRALGTGYDLGIFSQVVWNLAHGRIWQTTLVFETYGYYDHFEPILTLLVPLYWLQPDVRMLLLVQALALALGSLPIYLYAYVRLGRVSIALLLAAAYLIFPALHNANLYDFHEVAFLPLLLGFALYGLLRGQRRVLFVSLALALLVKEDVAVTALAFGVYIALLRPAGFRRRDGVLIAALALAWMVLVLNVFYPALTRGMPYPFVARRYSWLAETPAEALEVLLTRPWQVLPELLSPPKLLFLVRLFGPLLFLPLLGWPVIGLALPILFYLMLSSYEPQWSVRSYYNPPLLPILFFALVETLHWLQRRGLGRRAVSGLVAAILVAVSVAYVLDAPGPGGRRYYPDRFRVTAEDQAAYDLLATIPDDASVSAPWHLLPHLSHREQVYPLLARPADPPSFLLHYDGGVMPGPPEFPYAMPDGWPPVYHEYAAAAVEGPYRLQTLQRSVPLTPLPTPEPAPEPLALAAYGWLDGADAAQPPVVAPGEAVRLMLAWRRTGALDRPYVLFVHLLDPQTGQAGAAPRLVAQNDHEPGDGRYPTTQWDTWTRPWIVLDEQRLVVPTDTEPGVYQVWAGAYDRETLQRIDLGGPGQTLVLVGELAVR